MENKIRVLIAEDLEPIRKKYVYYLSQCADIELVGSAESGNGNKGCRDPCFQGNTRPLS